MISLPVDQVLRSVGVAFILKLNELDPAIDYGLLTTLIDLTSGRPAVIYENQTHPMVYGGYGTFILPGVAIEAGKFEDRRGQRLVPITVSISRLTRDTSDEIETRRLGILCERIKTLIFKTKCVPVYSFVTDSDDVDAIIGSFIWADNALGTPLPTEEPVVHDEVGGWIRQEYDFWGYYSIIY